MLTGGGRRLSVVKARSGEHRVFSWRRMCEAGEGIDESLRGVKVAVPDGWQTDHSSEVGDGVPDRRPKFSGSLLRVRLFS